MTTEAKCDTTKTCCNNPNCNCKSKCPGAMVDRILTAVLKLVKITTFIGITLVLFDVHGMFKVHNAEGLPTPPAAMPQQ